jgi:hypothetical protein
MTEVAECFTSKSDIYGMLVHLKLLLTFESGRSKNYIKLYNVM